MMKNIVVLLVIFQVVILICCVVHNEGKRIKTELSDCRGDTLHFKANVPVTLCCSTNYPPCLKDDSLLTIYKSEEKSVIETNLLLLNWTLSYLKGNDSSSVQMSIPSLQESDSGMYACDCNGGRIMSGLVSVIGEVDPPSIVSVSSTIKGNVTVRFNSGELDPKYSDIYTVFAQSGRDEIVLCENRTIVCMKRNCTCEEMMYFSSRSRKAPYLTTKYTNVTISVIKKRLLMQSKASAQFNLLKHVKPAPVDVFRVENKSSTSATLAMCAPYHKMSWMVIYLMNSYKSPFRMYISVNKTQGVYEERKFDIPFRIYNKPCLRVPLSQLTPFTKYRVSVTTSGGGGNSTPTFLTFTTDTAAPLSPPEDIMYWMVSDVLPTNQSKVLSQQKLYSININWKPIPHDDKGGDISFVVNVFYERIEEFTYNVTDSYIVLPQIPDTPVNVTIRSKNEMGFSKSYSYLYIERDSVDADIKQLKSRVETAGNHASISIENPPLDVKISSIYSCLANKDPQLSSQVVCKKYPKRVFDGTDFQYGSDVLSASIRLKKKECNVKTVSETKQEMYSFLERLELDDQSQPQLSQNSFTVTRWLVTENDLCASSSLDYDEFEFSTKQPSLQPKFMFSVDKSPRLFPFKCYYDNEYDTVALYFNQSKDGDDVSLSWRQRCDSSPQQFLAKEYNVYTSKDGSCSNSSGHVTKVENTLMQHSTIEIPETNDFACIVSLKTSYGKLVPSKAIPHQLDKSSIVHLRSPGDEGDSIEIVITTFVAIGVISFLLVVSFFTYRKFKKNSHFWKKYYPATTHEQSDSIRKDDSCNADGETGLGSSVEHYEEMIDTSSCDPRPSTPVTCDFKIDSIHNSVPDLKDPASDSGDRSDSGLQSGSMAEDASHSSSEIDHSTDGSDVSVIVTDNRRAMSLKERLNQQLRDQHFF